MTRRSGVVHWDIPNLNPPKPQREALLLVGAEGYSYEEAAAICGTRLGTIKSRVNRARTRLAELMGYDGADVGPERGSQAAMSAHMF